MDDRDDRSTGSTASRTSCTSRCSSCSASALDGAERRDAPRLRFRLAGAADRGRRRSPAATTEVGTPRTPSDESIVFQIDEDFTIPPARPAAYVRRSAAARSRTSASPTAWRARRAPTSSPFGIAAAVGDALYLGFDEPLERLLVRVDVDCSQARGAGVDPEDPPLRWEVVRRGPTAGWARGDRARGPHRRLQLRQRRRSSSSCRRARRSRRSAATARTGCAAGSTTRTRHGARRATYSHPPEIYSITAAPIGARVPADARRARGARGARRERRHARPDPSAAPRARCSSSSAGETLEVLDPESGDWARWELREAFVESDPSRPPLRARPRRAARSSSARRSARPTAAGASTARCRPRARCCA